MHATLCDMLTESCEKFSDKTFATFYNSEDSQISYEQLGDEVQKRMVFYSQFNNSIALYFESNIQWAFNFLAIVSCGKTAVLLDSTSEPDQILSQLKDANPSLILTNKKNMNVLKQLINTSCGMSCAIRDYKTIDFQCEIKNASRPSSTTDAIILYTSGSFSKPKGVVLTHKALCESIYANAPCCNLSAVDTQLVLAPFTHIAGALGTLLLPIYFGTNLLFLKQIKPNHIMKCIKLHNVQMLIAPPVLLESIDRKIKEKISTLSGLQRLLIHTFKKFTLILNWISPPVGCKVARFLFYKIHREIGEDLLCLYSAGSHLKACVIKNLCSYGYRIYNVYGLSETCGPICVHKNLPRKTEAVGSINNNVDIRIKNQNLETGVGEIWVKSTQNLRCYYSNSSGNGDQFESNWFPTGDLGYLDSKSYLYVVGRIKDIIINAEGKNIYPDDIEEHFSDIEGITEMCAYGLNNKESQNEILVMSFYLNEENIGQEDIVSRIKMLINEKNSALSPHMRLQKIFYEEQPLPRLSSGKINKALLKSSRVLD